MATNDGERYVRLTLLTFEEKQDATSDLISSHDSKLNDIVARLQRIESSKNEQECSTAHVNIPKLKTQLRISGDSDEPVKNVEVFVARALAAVMKNVNDPDDDVRVKDALAEMLTVIEGKGGDATAVELGSVYLHIQCKSISKLRCILEWFLESNNSHQMLQLEAALNGIYGAQFKVCLVLSEESIVKLLDWTGEHVPCSESTSSVPISDRKSTQTEIVYRPADTRSCKSLPASEDIQVPTSSPTKSETGDRPADMPSPDAIQDTFERYKQDKDKEEKDRYKTGLNIMCDKVSEHIAKLSDKIVSVNACVDVRKTDHKICFLVQTNEDDVTIDTDHNVEQRKNGNYSSEDAFINNHSKRRTKTISPDEVTQIEKIIEHFEDGLFEDHSNIQMIHGCSVKSKGFDTENAEIEGKTCIVIYVTAKGLIPLNEEMLPKVLQMPNNSDAGSFEVPVDVREGGMQSFSGPKEFHQNVKMGCMIKTDGNCCGTVGTVLEVRGNTYFLTCAHMFIERLGVPGTYEKDTDSDVEPIVVYQNEVKAEYKIGEVAHAKITNARPNDPNIRYGVDIALIELTDQTRIPIDGTFPDSETMEDAGFPEGCPMLYISGAFYSQENFKAQPACTKALKFGGVTECTRGEFAETPGSIKLSIGKSGHTIRLKKQLMVYNIDRCFSSAGDSGSIVFIKHNGQCTDLRVVGMVEAGNTTMTAVTPIWQIFDYLNTRQTQFCLMKYNSP